MSKEEQIKSQTKMCPQCEGTGNEYISLKRKACRKCHGTGTIEYVEKLSSNLNEKVLKTAQTFEDYSSNENDIDNFSDFNDTDTDNTQIHYSKENESAGVDDSLLISQSRSDNEIKRGIISMLISFDREKIKELFPMFCRILKEDPEAVSSQVENINEYTYYCLDNMDSEQLRNAFCVTRKFI